MSQAIHSLSSAMLFGQVRLLDRRDRRAPVEAVRRGADEDGGAGRGDAERRDQPQPVGVVVGNRRVAGSLERAARPGGSRSAGAGCRCARFGPRPWSARSRCSGRRRRRSARPERPRRPWFPRSSCPARRGSHAALRRPGTGPWRCGGSRPRSQRPAGRFDRQRRGRCPARMRPGPGRLRPRRSGRCLNGQRLDPGGETQAGGPVGRCPRFVPHRRRQRGPARPRLPRAGL